MVVVLAPCPRSELEARVMVTRVVTLDWRTEVLGVTVTWLDWTVEVLGLTVTRLVTVTTGTETVTVTSVVSAAFDVMVVLEAAKTLEVEMKALETAAEELEAEPPRTFSATAGSKQPTCTPAVLVMGRAKHCVVSPHGMMEKVPDAVH